MADIIATIQVEMPDVETINAAICQPSIDTNRVSDGYHTFGELYDHRITLYIALCRLAHHETRCEVWRSRAHSNGEVWDGWFILGINKAGGKQITYHLPESDWARCDFAETLGAAPTWDGHTSSDVLTRIKEQF